MDKIREHVSSGIGNAALRVGRTKFTKDTLDQIQEICFI